MGHRVNRLVAVRPHGGWMDDGAWLGRHRLLLWLLAAHIPGLLLVGAVVGDPMWLVMAETFPVLVALAAGVVARPRAVRACAVTIGLLVAGTVLVHLSGGMTQAHFHFFAALAFIALYQDLRPYAVAVIYVIVGHAALAAAGVEWYGSTTGAASPWAGAALHVGFVVAACVANVVLWKQSERQHDAAMAYYSKLYEGERAVVAQLRQTQTLKDELVGVVGHEFRTPLTAIQGFARTLEARYDRMDRDAVQTCTQAIERESKRLTRMVANLLFASEDITPSETDHCALDDTVDQVVHDIVETMPIAAHNIRVHVPAAHNVRVAREPAYQLLFNLVDNAVKFAAAQTDVRVTSRGEGDAIVVEVTNVGTPIDPADRDRIFDAFVQGDSSSTRRFGGMGLGLHIARKIVAAYGGRIGVFGEGPVVILRAWLPRAVDSAHADETSLSINLDRANHQ
jgi:signal transduction histidine kinase